MLYLFHFLLQVEWVENSKVYIRKSCLDSMAGVRHITDWVRAFLEGVFEEHEIPSLGVRKRKGSDHPVILANVMAAARSEYFCSL